MAIGLGPLPSFVMDNEYAVSDTGDLSDLESLSDEVLDAALMPEHDQYPVLPVDSVDGKETPDEIGKGPGTREIVPGAAVSKESVSPVGFGSFSASSRSALPNLKKRVNPSRATRPASSAPAQATMVAGLRKLVTGAGWRCIRATDF